MTRASRPCTHPHPRGAAPAVPLIATCPRPRACCPSPRWLHDWLHYLAIIGGLTPLEPAEVAIMLICYALLAWLVVAGAYKQSAALARFLGRMIAESRVANGDHR